MNQEEYDDKVIALFDDLSSYLSLECERRMPYTTLSMSSHLPLSRYPTISCLVIPGETKSVIGQDKHWCQLRRYHGSHELQDAGYLYSAKKGSGLIFDKDIADFNSTRVNKP